MRRLKIMGHNIYGETHGDITYVTVEGLVENNCTRNVRSVNVTVVFHLGNLTVTRVNRAALKIIEPSQKAPFEVCLRDSISSVDAYHLTAVGSETFETPIGRFEILKYDNYTEDKNFKIIGEFKNVGVKRARAISVFCACYGSEGELISIHDTHPDPITLDPNEEAHFEFEFTGEMLPEKFELFISAQRYEDVAWSNWGLLTMLVLAALLFIAYMKRKGW